MPTLHCLFNVSSVTIKQIKWQVSYIIGYISVAPDKVTIEGPSEAKVNDSLEFKCETSNSNPPATVQWVVDGRTVHATFTHSVSYL